MNGYGSHLPLLAMLFKTFKVETVLEFGMGDFSTPFFLQNAVYLHSIEMQDENWYKNTIDKYKHLNPGYWVPILALKPEAWKQLQYDEKYDLVFVDGSLESRPHCVNAWFGKARLIVCHDFNKSCYNWNLINKPENYQLMIFGVGSRSTAVYIHNEILNLE